MLRRTAIPLATGSLLGALAIGVVGAEESTSPVAEQTAALFNFVLVMAILVGVVVYGALTITLIRFRHTVSRGTDRPSHGSRGLEVAWSAGPALLLVVLTIFATQTLLFVENVPAGAIEIKVIGRQWTWEFIYPDGNSSSQLWIQKGATFRFNITSEDVVHSLFLPDFRVKMDANPGTYNELWLRPDRAGEYSITCAEYCGFGHYAMTTKVVVFEPEEGRKAYGPPPEAPPTARRIDLFMEEIDAATSRILPARLTLALNDFVELRAFNNGTVGHAFSVDAPYAVTTADDIPPGSYASVFLNTTQPAEAIPYWGGNATDRANGMEGSLTVTAGRVLDVVLREWSITPSEIRVAIGEMVTFRIRNAGNLQHNFTILAPYNVGWDPLIAPGETVNVTVTFDVEVEAEDICAVPGHAAQGMRGTLIVGEPQPVGAEVHYPFYEMALATILIAGVPGFLYLVRHAREGGDEEPGGSQQNPVRDHGDEEEEQVPD